MKPRLILATLIMTGFLGSPVWADNPFGEEEVSAISLPDEVSGDARFPGASPLPSGGSTLGNGRWDAPIRLLANVTFRVLDVQKELKHNFNHWQNGKNGVFSSLTQLTVNVISFDVAEEDGLAAPGPFSYLKATQIHILNNCLLNGQDDDLLKRLKKEGSQTLFHGQIVVFMNPNSHPSYFEIQLHEILKYGSPQ